MWIPILSAFFLLVSCSSSDEPTSAQEPVAEDPAAPAKVDAASLAIADLLYAYNDGDVEWTKVKGRLDEAAAESLDMTKVWNTRMREKDIDFGAAVNELYTLAEAAGMESPRHDLQLIANRRWREMLGVLRIDSGGGSFMYKIEADPTLNSVKRMLSEADASGLEPTWSHVSRMMEDCLGDTCKDAAPEVINQLLQERPDEFFIYALKFLITDKTAVDEMTQALLGAFCASPTVEVEDGIFLRTVALATSKSVRDQSGKAYTGKPKVYYDDIFVPATKHFLEMTKQFEQAGGTVPDEIDCPVAE